MDAEKVKLREYIPKVLDTESKTLVAFIGAMAHGDDNFADELADGKIGISHYPLSASVACGKICCAMEDFLDIV